MEVPPTHRFRRWVSVHILRRALFRHSTTTTPNTRNAMDTAHTTPQASAKKPDEPLPPPIPTCIICISPEETTRPMIKPCRSCTSPYCTDCVRTLFMRALETPSWNMPAKCCTTMMPLHMGLKYLSKEEALQYRAGFEEWSTGGKDRVYCPNLACLKFVPLKLMGKRRPVAALVKTEADDGSKRDSKDVEVPLPVSTQDSTPTTVEDVDCPSCNTAICLACRSFAHPNEPCSTETGNEALVAQLKEWGYKQCPRCGHGVRRMYGCSHMQCLCGEHFCWNCGRVYDVCENEGDCSGDQYEDENDEELECGSQATDAHEEPIQPVEAAEEGRAEAVEDETITPVSADEVPASTEQTEAGPSQPVPPVPPARLEYVAPAPRRRNRNARNLDSGGDRYWANQGLDFGDEPGDPVSVIWSCEHLWGSSERSESGADELIECHDCWKKMDGTVWECSWCYKVACDACKDFKQ